MNNFYKKTREISKYISEYNLACVVYGYKDVMKQPINLEGLQKICIILDEYDLKYTLSDFYYENINEKCVGKDTCKIIYISRDIEKAILAKEYDNCFEGEFYINQKLSQQYASDEATIGNGKLLGYPDCCIDTFIKADDYDPNLFYILGKRIRKYDKCHNYLNMFENLISHHIPCSFECEETVELCSKLGPLYIKSFGIESQDSIYKNIMSEKTYILFKSTNWIKIENGKYYFGSYLNNSDDIFNKIKVLIEKFNFTIEVLSEKEVKAIGNNKSIVIKDIQIFHFPEIKKEDKEYFII